MPYHHCVPLANADITVLFKIYTKCCILWLCVYLYWCPESMCFCLHCLCALFVLMAFINANMRHERNVVLCIMFPYAINVSGTDIMVWTTGCVIWLVCAYVLCFWFAFLNAINQSARVCSWTLACIAMFGIFTWLWCLGWLMSIVPSLNKINNLDITVEGIRFKQILPSTYLKTKEDKVNTFFLHMFKVSWCWCERADSLSLCRGTLSIHVFIWRKEGNSDECASCREVNGGIELWSVPRCQESYEANFQQHCYNGMCVPICEFVCVFVWARPPWSMFHLAQWIRCN